MRSKFEFASEAERRRYEKLMERKSRLNITGANEMHLIWGLSNEKDEKERSERFIGRDKETPQECKKG